MRPHGPDDFIDSIEHEPVYDPAEVERFQQESFRLGFESAKNAMLTICLQEAAHWRDNIYDRYCEAMSIHGMASRLSQSDGPIQKGGE